MMEFPAGLGLVCQRPFAGSTMAIDEGAWTVSPSFVQTGVSIRCLWWTDAYEADPSSSPAFPCVTSFLGQLRRRANHATILMAPRRISTQSAGS